MGQLLRSNRSLLSAACCLQVRPRPCPSTLRLPQSRMELLGPPKVSCSLGQPEIMHTCADTCQELGILQLSWK